MKFRIFRLESKSISIGREEVSATFMIHEETYPFIYEYRSFELAEKSINHIKDHHEFDKRGDYVILPVHSVK